MTDIAHEGRFHGLTLNARALAADGVAAGLRTIRRYFEASREEALLRTLDKRLLADIGFEPAIENDTKIDDTCRRAEFVPLWEAFSLTRFGK